VITNPIVRECSRGPQGTTQQHRYGNYRFESFDSSHFLSSFHGWRELLSVGSGDKPEPQINNLRYQGMLCGTPAFLVIALRESCVTIGSGLYGA
jgi:hypothetical protein